MPSPFATPLTLPNGESAINLLLASGTLWPPKPTVHAEPTLTRFWRMGEIAVLRAHIVNYAKTRDAYAAYRKAGYSKKFLEAHREEIELHKAAKAAFDEADLKKLPKVKDLNVEYFELLSQKKAAYPEYRKAKEEMQELVRAQKNVERFFAEEKQMHETEQVR